MTSVKDRDCIHLGLDVHKNTISVGVLDPDAEIPRTDRISSDWDAVQHLLARFADRSRLRACYEAGPTGYELARQLRAAGVACEVIAPSLIPTAPGDKVKTDRRDCARLARLHRAGELVAIRVPTVAEEAVRDLCRARADMIIDQTRARHRLGKFLLRHGRVWTGGYNWTQRHEVWIRSQRFDDPALTTTFNHYLATLQAREAAVASIEADLVAWFTKPPFADPVARLSAYRGISRLGQPPIGRWWFGHQVLVQLEPEVVVLGQAPEEVLSGLYRNGDHRVVVEDRTQREPLVTHCRSSSYDQVEGSPSCLGRRHDDLTPCLHRGLSPSDGRRGRKAGMAPSPTCDFLEEPFPPFRHHCRAQVARALDGGLPEPGPE